MRYERKYRTEQLGLPEVLQIIRSHPMSFRTLFPDRQVNNVYFDTPELHFLHENLQGVPTRRKFRMRWYGPDIRQASSPVLEMKSKDGELGDKASTALSDFMLDDGAAIAQALHQGYAILAQQMPQNASLSAKDLQPVLLNSYLRSYYISYDGRFRLTVDRQMRHYGIGAAGRPFRSFLEDEGVVIEIKYEQDDEEAYQSVAQRIPFRLARNSKYTMGMLMVANV